MKKLLIGIIIILVIAIGIEFYFQSRPKISKKNPIEKIESLSSIILENTKFKDFRVDNFSFKYPDNWTKIEIDSTLIWPREIAEKEKILLYLNNPERARMLVAKRELSSEDLTRPYPLIFREIFAQEKEIMKREGGLTHYQIIREDFFEQGVILESKTIIFSKATTSISKSIIVRSKDKGFIYSVGISAPERIFEDYRLLAEHVIDSVRYY